MRVGGSMKKILNILSCFILICLISGCSVNKNIDNNYDALKFKEEYEALNDSSVKMDISDDNPIKYVDFSSLEEVLTSKTGVIYLGFPSCPWCRNIIPVLFEVAKENDIDTIYYANPREIKDNHENYQKLKDILNDYLEVNDEGEKTLYVPDVYFVKDGKIVGNHLSSVDSQDDPYVSLTLEQVLELKNIYQDLFNKIK